MSEDVVEKVITVTPVALEQLRGLQAEKNLSVHGLRIWVMGGGCSGIQYGMGFDESIQESDTVIEVGEVRFIIDPASLEYVKGASIDFVERPTESGFSIENPNVASGCGCGGGSCGCH